MSRVFRVLSIDGGGIRGLIPLLVLKELERLAGRQIFELFDLIAGTSTGGIVALGLTKPQKVSDSRVDHLIDLYLRQGSRIFPNLRRLFVRGWGARFIVPAFDVLYHHSGIESVLAEEFGEVKLSEALTNVIATSYEIEHLIPFIFSSHKALTQPGCDFLMRDVARATSACPVFFRPHLIAGKGLYLESRGSSHKKEHIDVPHLAFADGGVFANNPTFCALAEANRLLEDCQGVNSFLIVSLGTGETPASERRGVAYETVKEHGGAWINPRRNIPLVRFMIQGATDSVDYALQCMLSLVPEAENRIRYQRYQAILEPGSDAIDNAGKTNLRRLQTAAARLIEKEKHNLIILADSLKELADANQSAQVR